MLLLHRLVPTLQAPFLALFSDPATPGHLAKSGVLKFSVVPLKSVLQRPTAQHSQCKERKKESQQGDARQRETRGHHRQSPARGLGLPRCTAALTAELSRCAFARILRTPVPHHESCFPLLHEPHLIMPGPGGAGGRWQGTAQGHANSRRSHPLSHAEDQGTWGPDHPPAALPPWPGPTVSLPTSPVLGASPQQQSWQLPRGPCGVCLAAHPGPPSASVPSALLSRQGPDREDQRVKSGGSLQPNSSLWGQKVTET